MRYAIRASFFDFASQPEQASQASQHARYLEEGLLLINQGKIDALIEWKNRDQFPEWQDYTFYDLRDKLIMPGFVDTHIHFPQIGMVGSWGEQLLEWLEEYTFPAESEYHDTAFAEQMASTFLDQCLENGTTSALIFGSVHQGSTDALFAAAEQREMRIIAGKVMMDRFVPQALCEEVSESYQQTKQLIERWHNKGRLHYALTPRFAPTSTPALLSVVSQLKREYPDVWIQTHLSENPQEIAWVKELFPEHPHYLGVYHHYGLTGPKSVFAHCLHLEESEWQCLAQTHSSISFCPTSNLFLGSGLFNLRKAHQHKVKIGMGTDIGAGTSFSLLRTLSEAYKVQQLQQYSLTVAEAYYHATLGGAASLSLDDKIGSFMPGKEADFIVIDLAVTPLQTLRQSRCRDIWEKLFVLMTLGDERNIRQTWVNGHCAFQRHESLA
ncbi:guanine deaminase [Rosenbergiella epipactidis]|uniref:guanine deaminase n=1 Tax=Rosenbergiella epipactidis TaxID=1544694 RepID=UPI001BDA9869|nr:guanine deaminase [Rosenbergiella epipactidis]MBT0717002.1 guanine deaminase [Rosenbergiella epipactidis]